MHDSRLLVCSLVFALAASPLGCGSKSPPEATKPVKGRVLLGDEPLTSGTVLFHPEGRGSQLPAALASDGHDSARRHL